MTDIDEFRDKLLYGYTRDEMIEHTLSYWMLEPPSENLGSPLSDAVLSASTEELYSMLQTANHGLEKLKQLLEANELRDDDNFDGIEFII